MRIVVLLLFFLSAFRGTAAADPSDPIPYQWQEALRPGGADKLAKAYLNLSQKHPDDLFLKEKTAIMLLAAWKFETNDLPKRHQYAKTLIKVGKEMIAKAPNKAMGYLWYGVGIESLALTRGVLNSLQLVPEGKKALERSIELDPNYMYGAAQLNLGRAFMLLPGFPLSIGNPEEALKLTLEGVKLAPNFSMGTLYLADLYWMAGRNEDALREARKVATIKPTNEIEQMVYEVSVQKAEYMIAKIKKGEKREKYIDWIWMELQPGLVD